MAYIGTSPTQAVRTRFLYTATASQTTFSGADTQNLTLRYSDANFVDVYQNGVLLKGGGADYTATTTTTVVLSTGATADDVIEIIVYDVFAVANLIKKDGDTVEGVINFNGKEITLDADFDTSITADTDDQIDIRVGGSDQIKIAAGEVAFNEASGDVDFRVESNGLTNAFMVDGGNNGIGFGHSPRSDLHTSWTQSFFGIEGSIISQVNSGGGIAGMSVTQNTYVDSDTGGYAYMTTNEATKLDLKDGVVAFSRAASGTAGNAITFSESMRIDSSGNVMIGETSQVNGGFVTLATSGASNALSFLCRSTDNGHQNQIIMQKSSTDSGNFAATSDNESLGQIIFRGVNTSGVSDIGGYIEVVQDGTSSSTVPAEMRFGTTETERMRIDSSGLVRIGNTSGTLYDSSSATGIVAGTSLQVSTDGGTAGFFNRLSSDGQILGFYKDGTQVGQISSGDLSSASRILIGNSNCNLLFNDAVPEIVPASSNGSKRDDAIDLGNATGRFDDIRATNGTIQTSDKNEKNTIVDSDLGIDFVNSLSPKSYKFNNKTRTHYGLIAQDVETVLGDIKKDASQFAGFCKDDISEKQDGSEYRYGLRYHEFISPMIQAIKDLKAEVDTLKAEVKTLKGE